MSAPVQHQSVPVPASLALVAERVERRLAELLDAETARWAALDDDLAEPMQSLSTFVLSGGKRLRPAFCHWGHVAAGGADDDRRVVDAGAAFELLQAFALVHDDVMDGSATRRGAVATHLAFERVHEQQAWRGEGRRFGEGVAILVGDLAHVYADHLMNSAPPAARAVWDELRIELNMGQYLDIVGTARRDTDAVRARRIARYKSGKYTIERPLHVGAAIAGGYPELGPALSGYGDPLGEAFQLRDDLLGAFGDPALTGKPVGDDLREGKPTPLLALATDKADDRQAGVLETIGDRELGDDQIAAIQEVFVATGAVDGIEEAIESLAAQAVEAIEEAPIDDRARTPLIELAAYVVRRQH